LIASAIWSCRFNPILYILAVGIAFLCEGGHFSMFPTACVNIFGIVNGGFVYSMMYCFIPLTSLASFAIVQLGVDYPIVFYIGAALTAMNMVLLYFVDETPMEKPTGLRQMKSMNLARVGEDVPSEAPPSRNLLNS